MANLNATLVRVREALTGARVHDLGRLDEALRRFGVTGVHGEAEVGVTSLIRAATLHANHPMIVLNLDGVESLAEATWLIARGIARVEMGHVSFSHMSSLAADLQPTSSQQAYLAFADRVGRRVASLAISRQPAPEIAATEILTAMAQIYEQHVLPPVLWIDHLEAPALTPRHPLDVNELLWNVRTVQQRLESPVIVSGHRAATDVAFGSDGAFHGDGQWVTIERPGADVWTAVAQRVGGVSPDWALEMAQIAHQHPPTVTLAIALYKHLGTAASPLEVWRFLLTMDDGHTARAMQHARSLHRLGGHVLGQVARGERPYEGADKSRQREIGRALRRLHLGGLLTRPRAGTWKLTNPVIAGRLRSHLPDSVDQALGREVPDRSAQQVGSQTT